MAQHLRDVARHDLVHLRDVLVQLADVALRARVQVQLLRLLDERVCGTQVSTVTAQSSRAHATDQCWESLACISFIY